MTEIKTCYISFRLRRTAVEDAYVRVPVTAELMGLSSEGGQRLDTDKVVAEAIRLGSESGTEWIKEDQPILELHPIQQARPEGR